MAGVLKEFREFAVKGNVVDLAVGVIIGGAFGKVVTSLVEDIIMPPIGLLTGGLDFKNKYILLSPPKDGAVLPAGATPADAQKLGAVTLNYGSFINNCLIFLIVAFAVFLLIKQINRMKREPAKSDPSTKECPFCKMAIPVAATRCPNCTSDLGAIVPAA